MKSHYKKSAAVHTFARLMDLLNDPSTGGNSSSNTIDGYGLGGHDHDLSIKGKHSKVLLNNRKCPGVQVLKWIVHVKS